VLIANQFARLQKVATHNRVATFFRALCGGVGNFGKAQTRLKASESRLQLLQVQ
jgi:hypothetical protein